MSALRRLHWLVGICAWLASSACGGAGSRAEHAETQARAAAEARRPELVRAGGAATLAVPRATEGALVLALFVDAGSRDATTPQLATATAWIAAARAEGVRVRVEPDGTEWSLPCTRARLAQCASQLAGVLATRAPDDAELAQVREAIVTARRAAASDDARTADALALAGVLGDGAAGAFGRAEDDAQLTVAAITSFAAAHYGPSRALFVGAGDVGADALREAVSAAMSNAPAAAETRAERESADNVPSRERVRVLVSESNAVSVALRVSSAARARAIAARLADEADDLSVFAFPMRHGGAVLLRASPEARTERTVAASVTRLVAMLETARREVDAAATNTSSAPDALAALATAYGRAFLTDDVRPGSSGHDTASAETDSSIAVGAVVLGGRAPSARVPDPDGVLARETLTTASRARELALVGATPQLRGPVTTHAASVVLANGARIEVRALPGAGTMALAVRFSFDAAGEPPSLLGRTALVATALVEACGAEARADDVELHPLIDARSFGVVATGRTVDALLRTLRCALEVTLDDAAVEYARRVLIAALDPRVDAAEHARTLAARAIAPETPALIAPGGDPDRIGGVPTRELRTLLTDARRGARLAVALAGDVDAADASARVGRRLATLAAGAVVTPHRAADVAADDLLAATWRGPGVRVVATLRGDPAEAHAADAVDARAFALALAERLAAAPGVRFVAADGDVVAGPVAWVALDVDEVALAAFPLTLRLACAALGVGAAGEQVVAGVRARIVEQMAAALASPAVVASELAAARIEGRTTRLAARPSDGLARVVDALASARPHFVIARPAGTAGAPAL